MPEAFQIFLTMIGLILVVFVPIIISSNREHARNLKQPKIERNAKIIDKRVDWVENSSTKKYFITCQFEGSDRKEVRVQENDYGILIVGDEVKVITQGTSEKVERITT
ncbi:hypothetical protein GMA19_02690 [Paenibacillus polymyxa E681]|uniref:DUF2500 domain-containing protein n=1 Tax=Paenibacillus polymyxa TaxID=1406 RepID=UPI0001E31FF4|nr:DUF2500 domain-containing protein [Paenibacillus polymyxa]ADM70493.1 hypothetical protein PPE_02665 [Paenibacillus polymyxa E681]QNV57520.1 hypothetical protein GE561_02690 [Paenibacillus polymyxa E681]QNV62357.1 hypothetical protein GMA19_02690 [Paenibacillus polymyxa E681]